jgi:putative ABC transport system permease protein
VLAFTAALSAVTVLIFGVVPAWRTARTVPLAGLLDGRAGPSPHQHRARRFLVGGEVALSLGLLALAGLLLQSFARLAGVAPGFEPEHALTFRLALPPQRYPDRAAVVRFVDELRPRLRALPGVSDAGSIQVLPMTGAVSTVDFTIDGRPPPRPGEVPELHYRMVGPGSLAALGVPILAGRAIDDGDGADAPAVIVVNRRLADRYFPDGGAVGQRLVLDEGTGRPRPATIVGVAGDVREAGLDGDTPVMGYVPVTQIPEVVAIYARNMFWVVRTAGAPLASARAAVDAVHAVDPSLPAAQVQTLADVVAGSVAPRRFNLVLVEAFALAALLLAAIGIYALTAQLVAARTRELGIRLALGAQPRRLLGLALYDGLLPVAIGVALGLVGAVVAGRLAAGLLFHIGAGDPATLLGAAALLGATAVAAAWLPARRVLRTDPLIVMRAE